MAGSRHGVTGLTAKLIDAGTTILAITTGVAQSECRHLMEQSTHQAIREHGLRRLPTPDDPLDLRYAIVSRTLELLREAFSKRGVEQEKIEHACAEMLALYERVRPRARAGASAASVGK